MAEMKFLNVHKMVLGFLETNCYIFASEKNNAAVVDPAGEYERILNYLKEQGLTLKKILLTHGHRDHIDACAELAFETGAEVYIHPADYPLISDYKTSFPRGYFPKLFKPVSEYLPANENNGIILDEITIRVMHVPGHTAGGVCYIAENSLFSGDTLFAGSIGNMTFETGDERLMFKSLERLKALNYDYQVFPGHGEETTLDVEKRRNIYLI